MATKEPRACELRHTVTLERVSEARDAVSGDMVQTWRTLLTTRAALKPTVGRELYERDQQHAEQTHRIVMRFPRTAGVTAKDRARMGTRIFEFLSTINLDERDRWLIIRAKERT